MSYELLWEPRGVVRRFNGKVAFPEMLAAVTEMHSDGRFARMHYVISDWLSVEQHSFNATELDWIIRFERSCVGERHDLHRAIVAGPRLIAEIAVAILDIPFSGYSTRFFTTLGEARTWLAGAVDG